jgi:anti-sigma factor RsiW
VLTCYLARRRLGAWLDGALDAGATRSTAAHVDGCDACRAEVAQLRRVRGLLQAHLTPVAPDWTGFWQGIVRGIDAAGAERRVESRPALWRSLRWALSGVATATVVAAVAVWQFALGPAESAAGVSVSHAVTDDPRATVMVYTPPERDVAVVWVFDLE